MKKSWLAKFAQKTARLLKAKRPADAMPEGLLIFDNTGEVIEAERVLRQAGFSVEVKGPPPDLRTGCDMVVVFPLIQQAAVENILHETKLEPRKIAAAADALLEPVDIFHVKDLGEWLMARAANMKITVDKKTGVIVNISGGGCPDVPFLAQILQGKKLREAPRPLSLGRTLCCYSLQKAFDELIRIMPCGL